MAPNLSWIDRDALRSLVEETAYRAPAASASAPAPTPTAAPAPAPAASVPPAPAPAFERAPEPDVSAPAPRPGTSGSVRVAARPAAPPAAALPPPPSYEPGPEPFLPPEGASLEDCVDGLMRWASRITGASSAFVADADGLLVASLELSADAGDVAAAAVQLATSHVPDDVSREDTGVITMRAGGRARVIAWSQTRHGRTFLGLVGERMPPSDALSQLSVALRDALR